MSLIVGLNACRNRSGGAKGHLLGILRDSDPTAYGIAKVHVWSYQALLDSLPDAPWLIKHNPRELAGRLWQQAWWEYRQLEREAGAVGCNVLLNTDAGSLCRFTPSVVMSRDMLSYEPGEAERYGVSKARLRLELLRVVQNRGMRRADGVIFLTEYAARVIQGSTGALENVRVIPHGVSASFRQARPAPWPADSSQAIRCLYVSNAAPYKHQWVVVRAIERLRARGHNVKLVLAGGGSGKAQSMLTAEINRADPAGTFIENVGGVAHSAVPALLSQAHLFIFASSCENMPNTLVEAMAAGLPIACSQRGPMPEIFNGAGTYFNPEDADSIADAVATLLNDGDLRERSARRAAQLAEQYSWSRCGNATWKFLRAIAQQPSAPATPKSHARAS